jgi:hypothetical protein
MMKLTRVVLACTLLLLVSFPLFARPQCGECFNNECEYSPTSGMPCKINASGMCVQYFTICSSLAPEGVLADWTVSSIEVSCPAADTDTQVATNEAEKDDVAEITIVRITAGN